MFESVFASSIIKRALEKGKVEIVLHNIRDFAADPHKTVDDAPYGGGAGMVMKPDVLASAVKAVTKVGSKSLRILLSAQGKKLEQSVVAELALLDQLVLVCGRYEGVDERFIESFIEREISVGDYVTSGGEIPAMIVSDAVIRLLPGVLGNDESVKSESFANGLLEYPQYTRPPEFNGKKVPDVLLSGNHKEIDQWRHERSLERTKARRPDMIKK